MASSVATPLEHSLGQIAGIKEMTSSSVVGSTQITLQFDLDRNIDGAAGDVQAAINAARSLLPPNLPRNPTYHKVNPADAPVMILALTSDTLQQGELYDAASTILIPQISQIDGIGQVVAAGSSLPAVRVELNPNILAKYSIDIETVRRAIDASNPNRPQGEIESADNRWQIDVNDRGTKATDYRSLVIAKHDGVPVRLSDVGEVTDSVEDIRNAGSSNGKPSVLLVLYMQAGANIIQTVQQVSATLPRLHNFISPAIDLSVVMDRTSTIRASLREVEHTLVIAIALVVIVVIMFLRQMRAAIIPATAVILSLMASFAAMYLFGYSIDNLSLMALTVATGFVVDDAVVVVENTMRHLEAGVTSPVKAAFRGVQEVGMTVVAMSLSLVAVFIPILFMGGVVGRLFREFAVTLSAAVLISLVVSLTITPVMCAYLLKKRPALNERPVRSKAGLFEHAHRQYQSSLAWSLQHGRLVMALLLCMIALNAYLYVVIPKGLFPQQDTGRLNGIIQADQDISFQAMKGKLDTIIAQISQDPDVEKIVGYTGQSQHDTGNLYIMLKPLSERKTSAQGVIDRLDAALAGQPGVRVYLQATQELHIGGKQSNAAYQYTLQADELAELQSWAPQISRAMSRMPMLRDVVIDQKDKGAKTSLTLDRDTLYQLGMTANMIDGTLYDQFGQRLVSNIYNTLNEYHVVMEVAPRYDQSPASLDQTYIVNAKNNAITFSAFSRYETKPALLSVHHQGEFPAATISFNLKPGVSLSEASEAIAAKIRTLNIPQSIHGSFQGTAQVFEESKKNQPFLILGALIAIYIVLGMLYESYIHPLTIISTLPSAGTGALLTLLLLHTEFSIIAFIGVLLLIGIVQKNAIIMINLAIDIERRQKKTAHEAIYQACLLRFRPIIMTTLVALFGVLPLAIGTGDGAELRQPLGISIVGGLIVSQALTLYTTPVVYLFFNSLPLWKWGKPVGARAVG